MYINVNRFTLTDGFGSIAANRDGLVVVHRFGSVMLDDDRFVMLDRYHAVLSNPMRLVALDGDALIRAGMNVDLLEPSQIVDQRFKAGRRRDWIAEISVTQAPNNDRPVRVAFEVIND